MAVSGIGTKLLFGTFSIGELTSIGGLALSADTVETTALDTAGGYRTFVQGLKDGGEVPIEGFYNPATVTNQRQMYTNYDAGTVGTYTIQFPTSISSSWSFQGIVTAFETGVQIEDNISFSSTLKVTGKPVLA